MKVPGTPSEEVTLPREAARSGQLCTASSGTAALEERAGGFRLRAARGRCALPRAQVLLDAHAAPQRRAAAGDLTPETIFGAVPSRGEGETEGQPLWD